MNFESELGFLVKGLIIGFSIAAPVGAIGVLCIKKSLNNGPASGFVSGLGAASADSIYGGVAAFGLSFISGFLLQTQTILQLVGGIFLVYLGSKTFLEKSKMKLKTEKKQQNLFLDYITTLGLTLTNPSTILSFLGVFSALGLANSTQNYIGSSLLVLGVFLGSAFWWLILSFGVGFLGKKLNTNFLNSINKISGITIMVFGFYILISLAKNFSH